MRIIATGVLTAALLTACATTEGSNIGYTQTNSPTYHIIDKFAGPDGEVTLFCRNGDLFVDKDGVRSGNIEFHFKHEKCVNK